MRRRRPASSSAKLRTGCVRRNSDTDDTCTVPASQSWCSWRMYRTCTDWQRDKQVPHCNSKRHLFICSTQRTSQNDALLNFYHITKRYGDSVENTTEENESVFSGIWMCQRYQQGHVSSETLLQQKPPVLNWECWIAQLYMHDGHKMIVSNFTQYKNIIIVGFLLSCSLSVFYFDNNQ